MSFNRGITEGLDGPGAGSLPLPAGSQGQIQPVSDNQTQILFRHLCKMSYFCLSSGGGWAKLSSPGCCSAPLPRCEGVWMPSHSLCDSAKRELKRADMAKQGGLQCCSACAVDKQNSSFSSAVHLAPFLNTQIDLEKKSEGKTKQKTPPNWCYLLDIL